MISILSRRYFILIVTCFDWYYDLNCLGLRFDHASISPWHLSRSWIDDSLSLARFEQDYYYLIFFKITENKIDMITVWFQFEFSLQKNCTYKIFFVPTKYFLYTKIAARFQQDFTLIVEKKPKSFPSIATIQYNSTEIMGHDFGLPQSFQNQLVNFTP